MNESNDYIRLADCKTGYLYQIRARNFGRAIYDGKGGFIGIRKKLGSTYLFVEYHWDHGEPYGTVKPLVQEEKVPANISLQIDLGVYDGENEDRLLDFKSGDGWVYSDTQEKISENKHAYTLNNTELFTWLAARVGKV